MRQGDLFDDDEAAADRQPKPWVYTPDLEKIRAELRAVVDKARASTTAPWDEYEFRYYRTVLPQMSRWLPDDERAEIIHEFAAEVARLTPVEDEIERAAPKA